MVCWYDMIFNAEKYSPDMYKTFWWHSLSYHLNLCFQLIFIILSVFNFLNATEKGLSRMDVHKTSLRKEHLLDRMASELMKRYQVVLCIFAYVWEMGCE